MKIGLTNFTKKHFKDTASNKNAPKGTFITNMTSSEYLEKLNNEYGKKILNGYAPFCKLCVVSNYTDSLVGTMPISLDILQFIRTGYIRRREEELPVLSRWAEIPRQFVPLADYLVNVLYSRDHLLTEHISMGESVNTFELEEDVDYGLVTILAQTHDGEEPMTPVTMMRNALGKDQGGSGVDIDRDKYEESVEFWKTNIIVRPS